MQDARPDVVYAGQWFCSVEAGCFDGFISLLLLGEIELTDWHVVVDVPHVLVLSGDRTFLAWELLLPTIWYSS